MRCKICDTKLTRTELTKKDRRTDTYTDTCHKCDGFIYKTVSSYDHTDLFLDKSNFTVDNEDQVP